MAFSNVALFGGAFLTPVIVGKMSATLGWEWSFYFVSIFTAAALPFVFFFVPETAFRRADYLNTDFTGDTHAPSYGHRLSGTQEIGQDSQFAEDSEQIRLNDRHSQAATPENSQMDHEEGEKHRSAPENETASEPNPSLQYSYWQTLRLFTGRKTDENFFKLFLRPFPLFFHPGILWVCIAS